MTSSGRAVHDAASEPTPPRSVLLACRLMLLSALVTAIGVVPTVLTARSPERRADVRQQLVELEQRRPGSSGTAGGPVTDAMIDRNITVGVAVAVVITVISIGLWVWMARRNRDGRGWARITATGFGVLNLVLLPISNTRSNGGIWATGLNVVLIALTAIILFLLWRPESSRYYRDATY